MQAAPWLTAESTPDLEQTVFRAFERTEFLEWPGWNRVKKILGSNGGCYGISGPRGAGKSWLMLRAIEDVREPDDGTLPGLGLWYPSPSEYDPLAFLASLSDSLANEIDRRYRRRHPIRDALRGGRTLGAATLLAGITVAALAPQIHWTQTVAIIIAASAAYIAVAVLATVAYRASRPEIRLIREAALVRERARYTATRREAAEFGAEGGRGFVATAKTRRERELVERPATLSTLVNDFRALAEEAGKVAGRVVIAVDELDKMSDPTRVRALLRDIKGIFEVPRVHFLVSVSDEAARTLNLGALDGRNEFNSSFYTVIELPVARPQACAELLQRRSRVPADVAIALAVIAGGNPRELLRLAELVGPATTGQDAVVRALREEAISLRREIATTDGRETAGEGGRIELHELGPDARINAFNSLPDSSVQSPGSLVVLGEHALADEMWTPMWADLGWNDRFAEPWRRLMLRLAVGGRLASSESIVREADIELLQDVVIATSQSSAVGRIVLESRLQLETRRPTVEQPTARSRLDELARRFQEGWSTPEMDGFVSEARSVALAADMQSDQITTLIRSKSPGERVVGLAAVQATADPGAFEPVLDTVRESRPFEQFHALSALESLRPGLSEKQRQQVGMVLTDIEPKLPPTSARRALVERIVQGIERDAAPLAAS
jgi:hypothetical protein